MPSFALSVDARIGTTSRPVDDVAWIGHSFPYWEAVRAALDAQLSAYPRLPARRAERELFSTVHTPAYLLALDRLAAGERPETEVRLSPECLGLEFCLPGYAYSLGGMLAALDAMADGHLDRAYCFSLGGHHGYPDWGHGYCLLNPLAAAVRYAQGRGFERVLIIDWDIHHGDGTQTIFANDASVHCISIHSVADLYMAKIGVLQLGTTTAAAAVGHRNIPLLSAHYDGAVMEQLGLSGAYYRAAESLPRLFEALDDLPWVPDLICTFSGYDSHIDDCGRGITDWDDAAYRTLTRYVLDLARAAGCPVLSVHGGGYTFDVALRAAYAHIEILAGG